MGVNLAGTLPALLAARGMTQEELASTTGIRRTDINALARGRIEAGQKRLRRIAEALDVSVLDLGVPEGEADARGQSLLDRQEEIAATVGDLLERQVKMEKEVASLRARLRKLEAPAAADAAAPTRPRRAAR